MQYVNRRTAIHRLSALALCGILISLAGPAIADGKIFTSWGKAIRGYDPVAYFTQHKPVEGSAGFTHQWMGAKWRFANAANRDAFAKTPAKYAPQYGGYCAWAVSQGYTASTDPEAWKIVNGKLYLNYSKSVQQQWTDGGIPKLIKQGDKNWPGLRKGLGG